MNSEKLLKEIGQQIAIVRNRSSITQTGLSARCGMPDNQIGKYEKGQINITLETLAKIASVLDCHIEIKIRKNRGGKKTLIEEEQDELGTPAAIIRMRKAAV